MPRAAQPESQPGPRATQVRNRRPIEPLLRPFQEFARLEASSGLLLLACTVLALVWANSPWSGSYTALWQTHVSVGFGSFHLSKELIHWINDGLMAVFFFVVGLEIKREMLVGELSTPRQAALPIFAALGGMVAPALLFSALNPGGPAQRGWGVPMATDIAFSLGVLALLGSRAPTSLKIFLTAFAIADDLGAVLVIALFYTEHVSLVALGIGAGLLLLSALANLSGIRNPIAYWVIGLALWVAVLKSGVHATIAGVLLALTIPASARIDRARFLSSARGLLDQFEEAGVEDGDIATSEEQQSAVYTLEERCEQVQTPLQRLEHSLHPWVSYVIMPIFALANAGVSLGEAGIGGVTHPVSLGVVAGLLVGKPLGITLLSWLAVRLGLAQLPSELRWPHILAAGCLGGIGFTMALFVADLAFGGTPLLGIAKLGVLTASLLAGVMGYAAVRWASGAPAVAVQPGTVA